MTNNGQPSQRDPKVEEWARAAATGDKRAFVEIVTRYQGMVTGVALAILRDFAASGAGSLRDRVEEDGGIARSCPLARLVGNDRSHDCSDAFAEAAR